MDLRLQYRRTSPAASASLTAQANERGTSISQFEFFL